MQNEGKIDRVIRSILGVAVLAAAWYFLGLGAGAPLGIVAAVIGLVLIVPGAIGFCPAYQLVGVRTCVIKPAKPE
jgi:hypothetical protein